MVLYTIDNLPSQQYITSADFLNVPCNGEREADHRSRTHHNNSGNLLGFISFSCTEDYPSYSCAEHSREKTNVTVRTGLPQGCSHPG